MKIKKYKKTIIYTMILSVVFTLFYAVPAFAYDGQNAEITNEEAAVSDAVAETVSDNAALINKSDKETEENFFDTLYLAISENLSEILSVLTFIGSLVVMLGYKKGFLPLVSDGLKALANVVKSIGDKTENLTLDTENLTKNITDKIDYAENVLLKMSDTLAALEEKLKTNEEISNERTKLKTILSAEIDLLYEIFMAAALPQYLKDNVGERIALMKSELKEDKENEYTN